MRALGGVKLLILDDWGLEPLAAEQRHVVGFAGMHLAPEVRRVPVAGGEPRDRPRKGQEDSVAELQPAASRAQRAVAAVNTQIGPGSW